MNNYIQYMSNTIDDFIISFSIDTKKELITLNDIALNAIK